LKKARLRALQEGKSVNGIIREYLEAYSRVRPEREAAISNILHLSKSTKSRKGKKRWSREELHQR
jgi:hypothetical protein